MLAKQGKGDSSDLIRSNLDPWLGKPMIRPLLRAEMTPSVGKRHNPLLGKGLRSSSAGIRTPDTRIMIPLL